MVKSKIFLMDQDESRLLELEETQYVREEILQKLLAEYPDLLPGDQIDPENPRRWFLVSRELAIPGDESENGRWSLDHLFLDQDGIPTFVECKRSTDTRNRREVVAQMLDYAANGIEYWSIDKLRQAAAETARQQNQILDEVLYALLDGNDEEIDLEEYWEKVEFNLRNKKVRLVFVADSTPKELRRLVEFLNDELKNVEVLAVEIKQFRQEGNPDKKAIVPRVVGLTEKARSSKKNVLKTPRKTTREEFLNKCTKESRKLFQDILDTSIERGYTIYWGEVGFSIRAFSQKHKQLASFIYCFPPDKFQFYFHKYWVANKESSMAIRQKLLEFGVFKESGDYTLTTYITKNNANQMKEIYHFICQEVEKHIETQQK